MNLDITTAGAASAPDGTVVTLTGELDLASAPELSARIDALLAAGQTRLVIDLGELTFCDSTGIGILIRANNGCQQRNGYLRLAAPNHNVARVLDVVGLLGVFPTYRTVDAARRGDPAGLVVVNA
jgi:anti-sigma B factor antagonist